LGEGEVLDVLSTPHPGSAKIEMDNNDILIAEENYTSIPASYQLQQVWQVAASKELADYLRRRPGRAMDAEGARAS
jgi:hypothetical protein